MWKKILAALLASAMVVSALAGCNNGGDVEEETTATTAEAKEDEGDTAEADDDTESAESTGDIVEISLVRTNYNCNVIDEAQVEKVRVRLNEMLEERGATVRIGKLTEYLSSEYSDKTNLGVANNEYNMMWTASWAATIGTDELWRNDAVYDITDLLPGTMLWESIPEGIWEASEYDGKVLFVPTYKESYEGYDMETLEKWIADFGWDKDELDEVTWFDKLEPYLIELKEAGVKYPYIWNGNGFHRWVISWYDCLNDSNVFFGVDRDNGEPVVPFLTEEYLEVATYAAEYYEKGYVHEDNVTNNLATGYLKTTDWGFQSWTDTPGDEIQNASDRAEQDCYVIENWTNRYVHSTSTLGSAYTVLSSCTEEEAKACVELLGYLFSDAEMADVYMLGIEGEDFEYVEVDGETRTHMLEDYTYNHSCWESVSVLAPTLLDTEPADKKEDYANRNESADVSIAAGFRFDKSDSEIQAIYTSCANLFTQYLAPLEKGAACASDEIEEYLNNYKAELDAAGFETLYNEFVDQWNAWYEK